VLFVVLFGLDFGRVFLGYVTLNNAVRLAANFAADNPTAWTSPGDAAARAEYARQVQAEASQMGCVLPSPLPTPTFPGGSGLGSPAQVSITCGFAILTPVIGTIVGNPLHVGATAAFPIRAGVIAGVPVATAAPAPTPTPPPTPTPIPGGTPTPAPTPTPTPMCQVPNFKGMSTSAAQAAWQAAGFQTSVLFSPLVPPNYSIFSQSISKSQSAPCQIAVITLMAK
jgi:hypothetical protein